MGRLFRKVTKNHNFSPFAPAAFAVYYYRFFEIETRENMASVQPLSWRYVVFVIRPGKNDISSHAHVPSMGLNEYAGCLAMQQKQAPLFKSSSQVCFSLQKTDFIVPVFRLVRESSSPTTTVETWSGKVRLACAGRQEFTKQAHYFETTRTHTHKNINCLKHTFRVTHIQLLPISVSIEVDWDPNVTWKKHIHTHVVLEEQCR